MTAALLPVLSQAASIPAVPPSLWRVVAKPGDTVKLSEEGGVLVIDYDVNVDSQRLVGHITHIEASFGLELVKPLDLKTEEERILFDARVPGMPRPFLSIRPMIEDAKGERLTYTVQAQPSLAKREKGDGWTAWRTPPFSVTEAGGASHGIYESEGSGGNAWPDRDLRFLGFQIRVYADVSKKQTGRKQGRILLTNVATGGLRVEEPAFAFADALLEEKGDYQLAFQTRAAFQAAPVIEETRAISYDPESETSRLQRVAFPTGDLQGSWLSYRATDKAGKILANHEFRWDQDIAPSASAQVSAVDLAKPPTIGLVRVNPDKDPNEVGGVYPAGKPLAVDFRVFPPAGEKLRIEWRLRQYAYDTEITKGEVKVPAAGKGGFSEAKVDLPKLEDRDAARLEYRVVGDGGKVLDQGEYIVGIRHEGVPARTSRTGPLRNRDQVKRFPYNRTTFHTLNLPTRNEDEVLGHFRTMVDEARQISENMTYMVELADFEILPGVYDFALLDKIMDESADQGLGITIRLAHKENEAKYRWVPFTIPRNFDGAGLYGHEAYGSYSVTDPRYVDSWKRAFRAIHDRYQNHPAFEGYYVMQAGGEWAIPDEPWNGNIADYSWSAQEGFRDYLRTQLKLDLPALNKRWGTDYKDWSEVLPPQPDLAAGVKPDLRPQWVDFNRAKLFWRDDWFPLIAGDIRSYDPSRVVICYGGGWDQDITRLYGLVDYLHNGGNDNLEGEGSLVDAWKDSKLGWITEPHHPHFWAAPNDPGQRGWILDWSVYVMTAQAGPGGANLHVYYVPTNNDYTLSSHYGHIASFERMEMYKPILRELHGATLIDPPRSVAVMQGHDTLFSKHRTTFSARLQDLRRWFEMARADSIDYEFYNPAHEKNYKLIIVNPLDEVMSAESIAAVDRMARDGAWVVIGARSGHYSSAGGDEYALLKSLGITRPAAEYDTTSAGVKAEFVAGQKLFDRNAPLDFFSQTDMQDDLRKPETASTFWAWPYRWIPQSDYFGHYPGNKDVNGEVLARFPDGGAAISLHTVGKGKVVVFWGTPDLKGENMKGILAAIADAAGAIDKSKARPLPLMLQAKHDTLGRYYAIIYNEKPGSYRQPISQIPDGDWFVEDIVQGKRMGFAEGKTVREDGITLDFRTEETPLKILRFTSREDMAKTPWAGRFGKVDDTADQKSQAVKRPLGKY